MPQYSCNLPCIIGCDWWSWFCIESESKDEICVYITSIIGIKRFLSWIRFKVRANKLGTLNFIVGLGQRSGGCKLIFYIFPKKKKTIIIKLEKILKVIWILKLYCNSNFFIVFIDYSHS